MVILSASFPIAAIQTSIPSFLSSGLIQFLSLFTMYMSVGFNFSPSTLYDLSAILSFKCSPTDPHKSRHVYSNVTITYTFGSACGGSSVGSGLVVSFLNVE